jgi:hypothetical protein
MVLSFSYQCRNGTHQQSRGSPVKFFLKPNYPSDLGLWLIHDTLRHLIDTIELPHATAQWRLSSGSN